MQPLKNNIKTLNKRIESACKLHQRDRNTVHLLAVSKTQGIATLEQAYHLGLRDFGENYTSEAQSKISALPNDIIWHFIGPIQSNKSRLVAENFSWAHSIDRLKIATRLNEQRTDAQSPMNCLIQVNISNESQKSGLSRDEVMNFAEHFHRYTRLCLRGLMAIPKPMQSQIELENDFGNMQQLLRQLQQRQPQVDTLSMGMSADFELAIKYDATMIRIGTELFGTRPSKDIH